MKNYVKIVEFLSWLFIYIVNIYLNNNNVNYNIIITILSIVKWISIEIIYYIKDKKEK